MADNERSPLIATVRVERQQPRYRTFPHSTFRRFCTIALSVLLLLTLLAFGLGYALIPGDDNDDDGNGVHALLRASNNPWLKSEGLSLEEVQKIILETPDEQKARESSQYYTSGPHLAGKNLSQALWTRDLWQEYGVKSDIASYDVYINYPLSHRLALIEHRKHGDKVKFECSLEEDVLENDPTTNLTDRVPTFHGYSASGNVTAPYVFVNFGTYQDFEDLLARNVSLKGNIALAKYGRNFRGLKVKRAQELGMVGVVMYSDPQEDGDITEQNGYKAYPDGPARNPSSVQRGSVQYLSSLPGDPTTPGWPSKPGAPRTDGNLSMPQIPSLPISYRDAIPLLRALNGHGPSASSFNKWWQGGGLEFAGVEYNIGPTPDKIVLNLVNEQEYTTTPLWNVVGVINGTLDEVIILGNHRDAWIAGGAGDPNSGSAALNELIRSFGLALKKGWKPLRTIVFLSVDGEEYGLVGSTEWVEEYIPWLSEKAIAYLNVDVGARGTEFRASASPLLNDLIYQVAGSVPSPNQTISGQTVLDTWTSRKIGTMGSGSDFTAFQDFAGISSLDIGFSAGKNDPVYHYHSNYDSFHWMETQGDPKWQYHTTIAKIWGLLALRLSDSPIVPLSAGTFATGLQNYMHTIKTDTRKQNITFDFAALEERLGNLTISSKKFDNYTHELLEKLNNDTPWWKRWYVLREVRKANAGYRLLERTFLHPQGLDGDRSWFKHVVFAPGRWTGYAGATFPGLVESFEDRDLINAKKWEQIILEILDRAIALLSR